MIPRLFWFLAGVLAHHLLRERDDFEDRLGAIEAEVAARGEK